MSAPHGSGPPERPTEEQLETIATAARKAWGQFSGHDVMDASGLGDAMAELETALDEAGLIE